MLPRALEVVQGVTAAIGLGVEKEEREEEEEEAKEEKEEMVEMEAEAEAAAAADGLVLGQACRSPTSSPQMIQHRSRR